MLFRSGWCPSCQGYGLGVFQDALARENIDEEDTETLKLSNNCTECSGTRLNEVARNVLFYEKSIADISNMTVEEAEDYFTMLADAVKEDERENAIAKDAIAEILSRLAFLKEVGLSYLSLNRSAPTLSGGEAQRIRLASQLGTNLQGVCYVLDEPTIGLHPRDNKILLSALEKLADKGNSLLVVEHDEDTIRKADHVIDIGPGAGARGGQLIVNGTIDDLIANADKSLTGQYLKNPLQHKGKALLKTKSTDPFVEVKGAFRNNLKVDSVKFPLNRLTVVTGVSGSGKSTLSREVLLHNLRAAVQAKGEKVKFVGCRDLLGYEAVVFHDEGARARAGEGALLQDGHERAQGGGGEGDGHGEPAELVVLEARRDHDDGDGGGERYQPGDEPRAPAAAGELLRVYLIAG